VVGGGLRPSWPWGWVAGRVMHATSSLSLPCWTGAVSSCCAVAVFGSGVRALARNPAPVSPTTRANAPASVLRSLRRRRAAPGERCAPAAAPALALLLEVSILFPFNSSMELRWAVGQPELARTAY